MLPRAAESLDEAHAAIDLWEHYSRKRLDPTQRLTVEVMMAQTAGGRWAAATTGREMPRQNGKGDEVEVVELWGLVQRGEAILHTVHDAVLLATRTQDRMLSVIEGHADLRRKKLREWRGTGQQMIEMRNGGVIWYRTRTGGGGRGVDFIARLVVDEAQHAKDEHLSAITPTLFAHDNPQMNVLGTAGLDGVSAWWWSMRKRAMSDDPGDFGYVGHTAENVRLNGDLVEQSPVDVSNRGLWRATNPAVMAGRGQGMAYLEEQYRRLGPASFAREHLCVWDPPPLQDEARSIPIDRWLSLGVDGLEPPDNDTVRLCLDASPNGGAVFSVAGVMDDGSLFVGVRELLRYKKGDAPLKDRVVERALYYTKGHRTPLILPPAPSDAKGWSADLEAAGVELDEMTSGDYMEARARMIDAVNDGTVRHRNNPDLNAAVAGLVDKPSGDGVTWSRRLSSNIAPFVAATCALVRVPTESTPEPMIYVWKGGAKP